MMKQPDKETKVQKQFGVVGVIFFSALAAISFLRGKPNAPYIFGGLALFFVIIRFVIPALLPRVFKVWMIVAKAIGWANANILLSIVFFFILTPIGLLMRLLGNDKIKKKYDSKTDSYWVAKKQEPFSPEKYEQRF